MSTSREFAWKISVVGDPYVGKTSIIRRFVDGIFNESEHYNLGELLYGNFLITDLKVSSLN